MVKITKVSETPKWASSSESSEIFTILAPNNETKSRWRIDDASYVHFKMRASAYRRYRNSETEQQLRYPASSHISKSKCCNSLITSPYCPILVGISKFKVIRINSFVHILYACLQHVRQVCHYEWKSARTHAHTHTRARARAHTHTPTATSAACGWKWYHRHLHHSQTWTVNNVCTFQVMTTMAADGMTTQVTKSTDSHELLSQRIINSFNP